ncbi:MAG: outer membrane beta-barrel protein [Pseudomonadota bacterium]|nr:outer membrane beta-barrel protein [Gammaproteobacteria bacterium]MBU1558736.1 outer membrane beta-barrel protein [Gammaproteobacteria bacterium]MBU1629174.1 outer membrane beta-barrel protein [Gammaproteobacteria bacterium]MBU1926564.1 outer membrane beta-barrel protein [Gammaproteobacteria bacterium]MBU2546620.1 outer membrane beta-barrel protein [Gammaproteobacteria bacterium]
MRQFSKYGIFFLALTCSSAAFADFMQSNFYGFYVGVQPGYADLNYTKSWLTDQTGFTSVSSVDKNGFAGRVIFGFDFNRYFAAEASYIYLPDVKFNHINNTKTNKSFRQQGADLAAKLTLPFGKWAGMYGRGGMAWFHRSDIKGSFYGVTANTKLDNEKFTPLLGGGFRVNFNENFSMDLAYTRYFKSGDLPATNFYGIGFMYKFI